MIVNNKEYDISKLIEEQESSFLKKRSNGMLLSDDDINILLKYDINYNSFQNIKELLFAIDEILDENNDLSDLEELSIKLGEYDYYNYTNK